MALDLGPDLRSAPRGSGSPDVTLATRVPSGSQPVDAEVRGEDDEGLGEIDAVAAAGGEDAVVQDLQELVEDARVRLLDLVEEDDAERLLPDRVGQLAADVVSDVARRRADQPLVGVLRGELRHVEADVGALVAEQEARDRLGELGLADAGRSGEEGHARADDCRVGGAPTPVTARLTMSSMWVTAWSWPFTRAR